MRFINKRSVVVLAVLAALGISAGAYAYFTSTGTGTGSATVGSASPIVITQTGTPPAGLYPGTATQAVTIAIKNNGSAAQRVGTVTTTVTPAASGCLATDFVVPDFIVNATIPAGGTQNAASTIQLKETGVNQDACQGTELALAFATAKGATGTTTP
ncbi:MAG: hypothetical protein JWM31_2856 [Solirubrobacterales bacterium]|nr:hypothetical protein [Solirubrobacterales bacterium]